MIREALDAQIDGIPHNQTPLRIDLGSRNFALLQRELERFRAKLDTDAPAPPTYRGIPIQVFDDPPSVQRLQVWATDISDHERAANAPV